MILFYATTIVTIFTDDTQVLAETLMPCVGFCGFTIIAVQLIGSAYFQAVGKAKKALY
jgi:Na+-driven multidrug efflux pump